MMFAILIVISVIFLVLRFTLQFESKVEKKDIFKDMAHIWVGIVIGASLFEPAFWVIAGFLTVGEVVAFFYHKYMT